MALNVVFRRVFASSSSLGQGSSLPGICVVSVEGICYQVNTSKYSIARAVDMKPRQIRQDQQKMPRPAM